MARTLTEIYNDLTLSIAADSDLGVELSSTDNFTNIYNWQNFKQLCNFYLQSLTLSNVGVWRVILYIVAFGIWSHEQLWDIFQTNVTNIITGKQYGQLRWYVEQAKAFQYGTNLEWINNSYYGYSVIDDSLKIITQASANVADGTIILKVAKRVSGSLTPLAADELTSFTDYLRDGIAPAGTNIQIVSNNADLLRYNITVYVNSLLIYSTGSTIGTSDKIVSNAIISYIQGLIFDSYLKTIGLVDSIQAVSGVNNVVVNSLSAKSYSDATYTNILTEPGQQYLTSAGYLTLDTVTPPTLTIIQE